MARNDGRPLRETMATLEAFGKLVVDLRRLPDLQEREAERRAGPGSAVRPRTLTAAKS